VTAVPCAFRASLPAGQLLTAVCRALTAAGFQVAKSFDLRSAFAVLPDHACPQHGPAECDCQYCVLLVYGRTAAPGILIVHGSDARGWITLADPWLGLAAGMVGVLAGGMFDHFYFKIDLFQPTMTLEWVLLGLMLAAARLAVERSLAFAAGQPSRGNGETLPKALKTG
jgi:hypothetical protein